MTKPTATITELSDLFHGRDITELRRRVESGVGDLLTDRELKDAWQDFSDSMDANWLICDDFTFPNFVAHLIGKNADLRSQLAARGDKADG